MDGQGLLCSQPTDLLVRLFNHGYARTPLEFTSGLCLLFAVFGSSGQPRTGRDKHQQHRHIGRIT